MAKIDLPYGQSLLEIEVPRERLGEVVTPPQVTAAADSVLMVAAALDHPLGTSRLQNLARGKRQAVVVIDDITRETPTALMLPPVLNALENGGLAPDSISIVIALGTHRPMTDAEIDCKVGKAMAARYRVINTQDRDDLIYLGISSQGIPAWVNRVVAQADLRVGIGMIVPHLDAGFGGGAKILLPGVCGRETVAAFHAKMADIVPPQLGIADAALRLDLEKFVGERLYLDFIVNAILDRQGRLYRCVAGDFLRAHRAGVIYAREVYGVSVKRLYPLVIANAYPHQIDLWQSTKALGSGELMTATGGMLVLVADCVEGIGAHPLFADYMGWPLEELLKRFHSGRVQDPIAAAEATAVCRMKQRIDIGLVSSGLDADDARCMGFSYYDCVEEAIARGPRSVDGGDVAVLTHGGTLLPLLGS